MDRCNGFKGWSVSRKDGIALAVLPDSRCASVRRAKVLLHFRQDVVNLRPLRHGVNLRIVRDCELMVLTQRPEHLQHLRILILGPEGYLQFEMVSLVRLQSGSVLAHQDKERQE